MKSIEINSAVYPSVARIYKAGIDTGKATFETEVPAWDKWDASHLPFARIAAEVDGDIVGWAALTRVSDRCVYGGVAEVSVYVDPAASGRGVGTFLLTELIAQSESNGIWTLQAGIFDNNEASIHLHEKCGFRKIGYRERIGQRDGVWRNNVIMERRSKTVGI